MKVRTTIPHQRIAVQGGPVEILPVGTIIDHPLAYVHLMDGSAEPADEEAEKYRLTPERQQQALHIRERTQAGIHPDDFADYEAGIMIGYDPDGEPIPGPNAIPIERDSGLLDADGEPLYLES
jgi:hypothetical protein